MHDIRNYVYSLSVSIVNCKDILKDSKDIKEKNIDQGNPEQKDENDKIDKNVENDKNCTDKQNNDDSFKSYFDQNSTGVM